MTFSEEFKDDVRYLACDYCEFFCLHEDRENADCTVNPPVISETLMRITNGNLRESTVNPLVNKGHPICVMFIKKT